MVSLRIAFDMDGTLANLASAYAEVEERLFGRRRDSRRAPATPAPEAREVERRAESRTGAKRAAGGRRLSDRRMAARVSTRRRDRVWRTIESTPNFWTTLKPLEKGTVKRLYALADELNWEVFFMTQRPPTAGGTVQWQTHKWLVEHGFRTPSVIPLSGGRGKAASALRLDYLIDDTPQNCVDVVSDSSSDAILLIARQDRLAESGARRLGIGVAHSVHEVLDLLVQATAARRKD